MASKAVKNLSKS